MKLKEYILREEDEEKKAEQQVRLAKNAAERSVLEIEDELMGLEDQREEILTEDPSNFDLVKLVELEQDIAVKQDVLKRANEKIKELF